MVKKLQVLVLGERDQPLAPPVTVPALVLDRFEGLLAKIREKTPDATYDTVVRAVVIWGARAVDHSLASGLTVNADGSLQAQPLPAKLTKQQRAARAADKVRGK